LHNENRITQFGGSIRLSREISRKGSEIKKEKAPELEKRGQINKLQVKIVTDHSHTNHNKRPAEKNGCDIIKPIIVITII
jgi:hypothetical protein